MQPTELIAPPRDGASRAARRLPALDPASVPLDGRGLAEHLVFAQALTRVLIDVDDADRRRGDWQAFLDGITPMRLQAFLDDPSALPTDSAARLRRPHLVLLWTFLRLLDHARLGLDGLMARHLDHHIRDVLRLAPAPAVADALFVLLRPMPRLPALDLPAGLRLTAGRDAAGRPLAYALTDPVTVTQASVAAVSTLFVEKEVLGLADVRSDFTGTAAQQALVLLTIALGQPQPGDALPPGAPGLPAPDPAAAESDPYAEAYANAIIDWLGKVGTAIGFARAHLKLELFELRQVVTLSARRAANTPADRAAITATIEAAGQRRTGDPNWRLPAGSDPADLAANLAVAAGAPIPLNELPNIDTLQELAAAASRPDVRQFFAARLPFLPIDDFVAMMGHQLAIDSDWRIVNGLLHALPTDHPSDLAGNLRKGLGTAPPFDLITLGPVADLPTLGALIAALEAWFALPAETIVRLVATLTSPADASAWREALAALGRAHIERTYVTRRAALTRQWTESGLEAVLRNVTGASAGDNAALMERAASFLDSAGAAALTAALGAGDVPPSGRPAVVFLLEQAMRQREGFVVRPPRKETWLNLHARRVDLTGTDPWALFGAAAIDTAAAPEPMIGWALGSPLLVLGSGIRTVALSLRFADDAGAALLRTGQFGPFRLALSTADGWFFPPREAISYGFPAPLAPTPGSVRTRVLMITIALAADDPALAPPPSGDELASSPDPVLRLMLEPVHDPVRQRWRLAYDAHRGLQLMELGVEVTVSAGNTTGAPPGLFPLVIDTDGGPVDGRKPFLPFGALPGVGATVALAHPELTDKPLTELTLHLAWLGAPKKITEYFATYDSALPPTVEAALIDDQGARVTRLDAAVKLFDETDSAIPVLAALTLPSGLPPGSRPRAPPTAAQDWPRYLRLTLTPRDFQHASYPTIAARKAIELAKALAPGGGGAADASHYVVPPPYTPRLKLAGLGYKAARTVALAALPSGAAAGERLYHLHPFGHAPLPAAAVIPLLPAFDDEGSLYIGVADAIVPQSLPVLVALRPGSGDLVPDGSPVRWNVLGTDGWMPLTDTLAPRDGTLGLVRDGIIDFALPAAAAQPGPVLPAGLVWLRAAVARGAASFGAAVGLHAQAAHARLVEGGGVDPSHYAHPLPPGSVKGPLSVVPGLSSVRQPYQSFGGRPAENTDDFTTRVAERLRHRRRALTAWDYERLTLARFPELYKAKCLAARASDETPGVVRLVVIPDLRDGTVDPVRPRASPALLTEVGEYLRPLMPSTAALDVRNPSFVEVRVRVSVRLVSDRDPQFDIVRLRAAISRYLSPWADGDGEDIAIGRRIYATSLVAFINARDYVDFVGSVRFFTSTNSVDFVSTVGDDAEAAEDDAILIAASEHEIDLIGNALDTVEQLAGIGYMRIELDFRVAGGTDAMNIDDTKRTRDALKSYFVPNAIPTAGQFGQLIDSGLNQREDRLVKPSDGPLSIEATGPITGPRKVLDFYDSLAEATPTWSIGLRMAPNDPRRALSVSDGAGTSRLSIDATSGNVGIGTITPRQRLDVAGDLGLGGAQALSSADNWLGLNQGGQFSAGTRTPGLFAPGSLNVGGLNGSATPGSGNAVVGGSLGIGVFAPADRLHVDGRIRAAQMTMGPWPANGGYACIGSNLLDQTKPGNYALLVGTVVDPGMTYLNGATKIGLRIENTEIVSITASGRVGIKNTSPGHLLDVGGRIRLGQPQGNGETAGLWLSHFTSSGSNATELETAFIGMRDQTSVGFWGNTGAANWRLWTDTISGAFTITGNGFKPGGGAWAALSDARLKRDIRPLDGALDQLLRLRPVTFEWIEPDEHGGHTGPQIGFVAQEVEQVFPDWVIVDENGFRALAITGFEALTVEALRHLREENAALRGRIEALELLIAPFNRTAA